MLIPCATVLYADAGMSTSPHSEYACMYEKKKKLLGNCADDMGYLSCRMTLPASEARRHPRLGSSSRTALSFKG